MNLTSALRYLAGLLGIGVATLAGLIYLYQTALIYPSSFPEGSRTIVDSPEAYNLPYTEHRLVTPDRVRLHVYAITHSDDTPRPTILLLHANAGNMGHRLPIARIFYRRLGCHVVMLSYRGYGLSTGQPSEPGLRIDAQTVLDWIREHPVLAGTHVLAYGQSIGGAVAIDLAARNPHTVRGLVVENTFLSIPQLIPTVIPFLRHFAFLCHEIWPSDVSITKLRSTTPALFLSGEMDELVPPEHMKKLFRLCPSTHKEIHVFPKGTHSTSIRSHRRHMASGRLRHSHSPTTLT